MAFEWTAETAREMIAKRGAVVDIGQVTKPARHWLDKQVAAGILIKYRGYWNTLSPAHGMGPLKTIWATDSDELRQAIGFPPKTKQAA